jgi:hypothetical protein
MSDAALRDALAGIGLDVEVEGRAKVAVIRAKTGIVVSSGERRRIVALGRQHGFSNVSLELGDPGSDPAFHSG